MGQSASMMFIVWISTGWQHEQLQHKKNKGNKQQEHISSNFILLCSLIKHAKVVKQAQCLLMPN
jgi:hypothetical protein